MVSKVLILSRNYPNPITPILGLWVEQLVQQLAKVCDVKVISPVPYCPPLPDWIPQTRYRRVPPQQQLHGVEVSYPRFLVGPGYSTHSLEGRTYAWGIASQVERLWQNWRFDLIHAHFVYPDGVAAMQLGERYQVPVVITEHAHWHPWMEQYPLVRHQAMRTIAKCAAHIVVSRDLQESVKRFTSLHRRTQCIPIGVDTDLFTLPSNETLRQPEQILYVGSQIKRKGLDTLLKAMKLLQPHQPQVKLKLVGGQLRGHPSLEESQLRTLVQTLGLEEMVTFVGPKSPVEIAALMQTSALLVLPSLRETFGAVLVEALACGTPVVATRCGGPEDIVTEAVGVLVPPRDAPALGEAIAQVLERRSLYPPETLRSYALEKYSWKWVAQQTIALYQEILASR